MKKFLAVVLSVFMVLSLAACGNAGSSGEFKNVKDLKAAGFECTSYQYDDQKWVGLYKKADSADAVYKAAAKLSAAECEALEAISWDDEDSDNKLQAIFENFENITITDVTDQIPSQDELNKYVGKTFADLMADGYEHSGWIGDEEYAFYFDGKMANIVVEVEGEVEDPEEAPDTLVIKSVEFMDFGAGFFEE